MHWVRIIVTHHKQCAAPQLTEVSTHLRPWPCRKLMLLNWLLALVSDYYSNYIEVENISKPNTLGITKALMIMYARYGVPDTLVSDNGPQFSSEEFRRFATRWGFEHITSSPRYPQSNGKAENAVKTF